MLVWAVNKPLRHRIVAEAPGLLIYVRIYSPLGLFWEGYATDLGDGQYGVEFTPNTEGTWVIEYSFPDGYRVKRAVRVLPSLRLVNRGETVRMYVNAESPGLAVSCIAIKPDGSEEALTVVDEGNGRYYVEVTPDLTGLWAFKWRFPDGHTLLQALLVGEPTAYQDLIYEIYKRVSRRWA